ncbi:MAG: ATP synthase subunit I [Acidimicrobiales bacterium]|jgi:hypothetical protein|nr:hypothetical protein [Actinomycetota bacterium]MDA8185903.1 hypothetical protein [Actinomycetota bacterium]
MLQNLLSLSLPEIAHLARRAALAALAAGIVALVVGVVAGYALTGLGFCIGLGLGLGNFRMVTRSVERVSRSMRPDKRRPLATSTLGRLGVVSAVAVALLLVDAPLGFGTLVGLAFFEMLLLANVTVSLLRSSGQAGEPT